MPVPTVEHIGSTLHKSIFSLASKLILEERHHVISRDAL